MCVCVCVCYMHELIVAVPSPSSPRILLFSIIFLPLCIILLSVAYFGKEDATEKESEETRIFQSRSNYPLHLKCSLRNCVLSIAARQRNNSEDNVDKNVCCLYDQLSLDDMHNTQTEYLSIQMQYVIPSVLYVLLLCDVICDMCAIWMVYFHDVNGEYVLRF